MDNKLFENRKWGFDFIRSFAVVLVLIAHFAKCLELFGFWGVELFFGLSGYLIGQILWRNYVKEENWGLKNMLNFWQRRWWRTLPNYYLFLFISIPFHFFIMKEPLIQFDKFFPFLIFSQNLFSRFGVFYGVSWSLCIEEWLYLLFPIILFIYHKSFKIKIRAFSFTLLTIILASIFFREFLIYNGKGDWLLTITFSRIDSISYGILIAFIEKNIKISDRLKKQLFYLGLLLIIFPVIVKLSNNNYTFSELRQNKYLLIAVPLGSALILPFVSALNQLRSSYKLFQIVITKLSQWTYAIYLSHIPITFTVYLILEKYRYNDFLNTISKIIGFVITILFSSLVYKYFELPLTSKRPKEIVN